VVARPLCAQFGGFYLGGNVGWGYHSSSHLDKGNLVQTIDDDLPTSARLSGDGWNAGVQGGYNWQPTNCTVFGVEADWSWTNIRASANFSTETPEPRCRFVDSKMKWFGTLRTRGGIVVDNILLYVTGGLAYANFDRTSRYLRTLRRQRPVSARAIRVGAGLLARASNGPSPPIGA
jgi:outer membrane immunogenic protein